VSAFHFRFWCKYLCPIGAFNGLIAHKSLVKIKLGDKCDGCQICDRICPVEAITMDGKNRPVIDYPECILCGKCIEKCPEGALNIINLNYEKK
jgi:polyferredoxin